MTRMIFVLVVLLKSSGAQAGSTEPQQQLGILGTSGLTRRNQYPWPSVQAGGADFEALEMSHIADGTRTHRHRASQAKSTCWNRQHIVNAAYRTVLSMAGSIMLWPPTED